MLPDYNSYWFSVHSPMLKFTGTVTLDIPYFSEWPNCSIPCIVQPFLFPLTSNSIQLGLVIYFSLDMFFVHAGLLVARDFWHRSSHSDYSSHRVNYRSIQKYGAWTWVIFVDVNGVNSPFHKFTRYMFAVWLVLGCMLHLVNSIPLLLVSMFLLLVRLQQMPSSQFFEMLCDISTSMIYDQRFGSQFVILSSVHLALGRAHILFIFKGQMMVMWAIVVT